MDKKKIQRSKSPRQGSRLRESDQQAQMALAQQLGIPLEYMDPNLMAYASGLVPAGMDPQQLLNPMAAAAAASYPFMNPAALQAFTGLGSFGSQSGTGLHPGAAEWWNLAQNQAIAASLGAGFYPGMIPPGFPSLGSSDVAQKSKSSTSDTPEKSSKESSSSRKPDPTHRVNSPFSPSRSSHKHGSSGLSIGRFSEDRKKSSDSQQSATKGSYHSLNSLPHSSQTKHNSHTSNASWLDGLNGQHQQKLNEQVMQAEMMRQLEQQFLVQQLQLQQQDQLNATLQCMMTGALPGTSGSMKKGSSAGSDKLQDQISAMFQQLLQAGGHAGTSSSNTLPEGITPAAAASLLSTPGAMEAMMAMTQMGNMNALSEPGGYHSSKKPEHNHRDKKSPSSNNHSSKPSSSTENQKSPFSSSSSKTKMHSSPQKSSRSQVPGFPGSLPGLSGTELSPDNAFLATLYSQQLQQQQEYEALIQKEMEAVSRLRDQDGSGDSSKSKSHVKQESHSSDQQQNSSTPRDFASPSIHNRSDLYSPANSTSSRGKSHTSPNRDSSHSPSRKLQIQERSQSRGSGASSTRHDSPKPIPGHSQRQDNMAETAKLFSALAANSSLTKQELAALMSLPGADPNLLLSGMNAMGGFSFPPGGLLEAAQGNSQMTPSELEKLNKQLATMLAYETQKLQEQLRQQQFQLENNMATSKKDGEKDNHISVIHQNNHTSRESSNRASSSRVYSDTGKHSNDKSSSVDSKMENGDIASSDGEARSENSGEVSSTDRNNYMPPGRHIRKRRRVITNEEEILEPLKHGWKREVRFKFIGNQLRGEVIYISPSGKKFRTYPDVVKHLEDNKMTHLHRNNFSFSSRLRIGSFYEQKDKASRQWVKMTEEELEQRIQQLDSYRGQYHSISQYTENSDQVNDMSSSKEDGKNSKSEKEDQEHERSNEQFKLLRHQEKLQKFEQQRMEREIRERIAADERQNLEEVRKLKFQEALRKAKELERQRMAEALDRDQRRQQMLLMRALESRKRAEERERRREEMRVEKMMQRERKMEQRRIAMQIARELKMPVEDMSAIGGPELPELTPLQGTLDNKCPYQLSGNATADLLMVLEFVKTFKECLRIQDSTIPTLSHLQQGILSDPCHSGSVVQITMTLLHQCLCDPGVPAPGPWLHCLTGVKVTDIDVTEDNYSEILRLFIWARNGYKTEIAVRLESLPFLSLTADEKAQSLAFLVNELVCSQPICMEIEKNLDALATLRRDKWIVEGQMRQLRVTHERNHPGDSLNIKIEDDENSNSSNSPKKSLSKNGANGDTTVKEEPQEEFTPESIFQKKISELTQQHNSFNTQLANNSKPLRAVDLGQDRYKRRYWVLPNLGGVYVEGLESGISYEDDEESPDEDEDEEEKVNSEETKEMDEKESEVKQEEKEETIKEEENVEKSEIKEEEMSEISKEKEEEGKMEIVREEIAPMKELENEESCDQSGTMEIVSQENDGSIGTEKTVLHTDLDKSEIQVPPSNNDVVMQDNCENSMVIEEQKVNTLISDGIISSTVLPGKTIEAQNDICENSQISIDNSVLDNTSVHTNQLENSTTSDSGALQSHIDSPTQARVCNETDASFIPPQSDSNSLSTCQKESDICSSENDSKTNKLNVLESFLDPKAQDKTENITVNKDEAQTKHTDNTSNNLYPKFISSLIGDHSSTNQLVHQGKPGLDIVTMATKGALRDLQAQDRYKEEPDNVLAAAKEIAVKAVASSNHLLFRETVTSPMKKAEVSSEKMVDSPSSETGVNSLPIGNHTINALVEMGVNPTSLTSQQLEVLSHLDIPSNPNSTPGQLNTENEECLTKSPEKSATAKDSAEQGTEADPTKTRTETGLDGPATVTKKLPLDQDAPMDLSCSVTSEKDTVPSGTNSDQDYSPLSQQIKSSPLKSVTMTRTSVSPCIFTSSSDAKSISVKQEPTTSTALVDSSSFYPIQDIPDMKFAGHQGEKFFIPISFSNNVKMDPGYGPQQFNQFVSSCPSPNTLANLIVSSANYPQFPSLEDIKFPIRAPDVKEEPDIIPRNKKRGWWRMESEIELRGLCENLHLRGIREKQLHRNITKNFEICTSAMFDAVLLEHRFSVFENEQAEDVDTKEKVEKAEKEKQKVVHPDFTDPDKLAFDSEMKVLYEVEELSEKCCNMAVVSTQWRMDNPKPSVCRLDLVHVQLGSLRDSLGNEIKFDITNPITHDPTSALGVAVDLIGRLERAVCRRYLKPPLVRKGGATEFSSLPSLSESGAMDVAAGLRTWRNAVASSSSASQLSLCVKMLEVCIAWNKSANSPVKVDTLPNSKTKKRKAEKRPNSKTTNSSESLGQPKKKRKKRTNISKKPETSVPAAESKKTKRARMPIDTADVISKSVPNSADEMVNSEKIMVNGDSNYEATNSVDAVTFSNALSNSFDNSTASNESCRETGQKNGKFDDVTSPSADYHTNSDNVSEEYRPSSEIKKKKKKKKAKKSKPSIAKGDEEKKSSKEKKKYDKDTALCRTVLRDLQSHEAATWFLFPVDCKVVPGYRKIIKKPIDFHTIDCRLKKGRYKARGDFVAEVRLVFDNCQKFNEDDSNIGRAGHELRDFFNERWTTLTGEKFEEVSSKTEEDSPPNNVTEMPETAEVESFVDEADVVFEETEPEVEMSIVT